MLYGLSGQVSSGLSAGEVKFGSPRAFARYEMTFMKCDQKADSYLVMQRVDIFLCVLLPQMQAYIRAFAYAWR